ncbi:MAG: response regulator [Chloroflexi bacterium]|nr:response regulator [Chloroflexota bacterium]MBP8055527.1 response regulator [Chloroflexota bacterium]
MGKLLLVVDDELEAQTLLRLMLVRAGFDVAVAASGTDALKQIDTAHPDVVILDVMMPGMDGFTVCEKIRANNATHELPVIILSARSDVESRKRGESVQATRYLTKPISPMSLVKQIQDIVADLDKAESH